jgi:hypothetical protein
LYGALDPSSAPADAANDEKHARCMKHIAYV